MSGDEADLHSIHALVRNHCGLRFEGDDAIRLQQAVAKRIRHGQCPPSAYLARLQQSSVELQALIDLLTINETYFFREPEQLELIVAHILPRLLAAKPGQTRLRILSAGCSSGEEPYSLAIALSERYGLAYVQQHFSLLGADLDSQALAAAARAQYSNFSFRGVAPRIRAQHFDAQGNTWQLKPALRTLVSFHPLNLLASSLPPALQDCDLILLRNVSIYFDTETRRQIQHQLSSLLKSDGFLIVGSAETLANDLGVLRLVEEKAQFYFIKGQPPLALDSTAHSQTARIEHPPRPRPALSPATPLPLSVPAAWLQPAPLLSPGEQDDLLEQVRRQLGERQFSAALPLLERILASHPEQPQALLLKAYLLLEKKDFAGSRALAEKVLATDEWSVDACILLGLAAKWSEDAEQAIRFFRQAVYIGPECWPAHYFLADLWQAQGKIAQARRHWRLVLQNLTDEHSPRLCTLPLALPAAQIRFLCERQLARPANGDSET